MLSEAVDNVQIAENQIEKRTIGFIAHPTNYVRKLTSFTHIAEFVESRPFRVRLAWATNTRPNICHYPAILPRVIEEMFTKEIFEHIKKLHQ